MSVDRFKSNTIIGPVGSVSTAAFERQAVSTANAAIRPLQEVSRMAEESLTEQRTLEGQAAGAKAVIQRDDNGSLIMPEAEGIHSTDFTIYGKAYREAVESKYLLTMKGDISTELNRLFNANRETPGQFKEVSRAYLAEVVEGAHQSAAHEAAQAGMKLQQQYAATLDAAMAKRKIDDANIMGGIEQGKLSTAMSNLSPTLGVVKFNEEFDKRAAEMATLPQFKGQPGKLAVAIDRARRTSALNYANNHILQEEDRVTRSQMIEDIIANKGEVLHTIKNVMGLDLDASERIALAANMRQVSASAKRTENDIRSKAAEAMDDVLIQSSMEALEDVHGPEAVKWVRDKMLGVANLTKKNPELASKALAHFERVFKHTQDRRVQDVINMINSTTLVGEARKAAKNFTGTSAQKIAFIASLKGKQAFDQRNQAAAASLTIMKQFGAANLTEDGQAKIERMHATNLKNVDDQHARSILYSRAVMAELRTENTKRINSNSLYTSAVRLELIRQQAEYFEIHLAATDAAEAGGQSIEVQSKVARDEFALLRSRQTDAAARAAPFAEFNRFLAGGPRPNDTPKNRGIAMQQYISTHAARQGFGDESDPTSGETPFSVVAYIKEFGITPQSIVDTMRDDMVSGDKDKMINNLGLFREISTDVTAGVNLMKALKSRDKNVAKAYELLSLAGPGNPGVVARAQEVAVGKLDPTGPLTHAWGENPKEKAQNFMRQVALATQGLGEESFSLAKLWSDLSGGVAAGSRMLFTPQVNILTGGFSPRYGEAMDETVKRLKPEGAVNPHIPDWFYEKVKEVAHLTAVYTTGSVEKGATQDESMAEATLAVINVLASGEAGYSKMQNFTNDRRSLLVRFPIERMFQDKNNDSRYLNEVIDRHIKDNVDTSSIPGGKVSGLKLEENVYLEFSHTNEDGPVYNIMMKGSVNMPSIHLAHKDGARLQIGNLAMQRHIQNDQLRRAEGEQRIRDETAFDEKKFKAKLTQDQLNIVDGWDRDARSQSKSASDKLIQKGQSDQQKLLHDAEETR